MSFVSVAPEALTMAAGALWGVGDGLVASGVAADRVTSAVVAPGGDEVSAVLAACLCRQAAGFRRVGGPVAVSFREFVAALSAAADEYSTTETGNAACTG